MSSRQATAPSSNPRVTGNVPIRMLFICSPASESATRAIQVSNTSSARPAQGLVPQSSGGQEPLEIYPPHLPAAAQWICKHPADKHLENPGTPALGSAGPLFNPGFIAGRRVLASRTGG